MLLEDQYKIVIESLKLLSASEQLQKLYLPSFADVPHDVTSTFENAILLLPQLIDNYKFSFSSIASLLRLHNRMQWCLTNVGLDDFSNAEWNKIRELAKETLLVIGEPLGSPDLKYV